MEKSEEIWEEKLAADYAEKSVKIYRRILDRFLEAENLTHDGLFNMHYEAQRSDDPRDRDKVARKVKTFRKNMVENGSSTSHADQIKNAVKAFMDANGLDFKIRKDRFKVIVEGQNRATTDHIAAFLEATGEYRTKALTHVLKDTGLRVSDVVQLNVGDVVNGGDYVEVKIRQVKTKNVARPIMGPDSIESVTKWLKYREKRGHPYTMTSPLFTEVEGSGAFERRMSSDAVTQVFVRLCRKTGLNKITAHSLRKFNQTRLQAGGVPDAWIYILQGRTIPGSFAAYSKPNEGELMTAYMQAYEYLSIRPEQNMFDAELSELLKYPEVKAGFKEFLAEYKRKTAQAI